MGGTLTTKQLRDLIKEIVDEAVGPFKEQQTRWFEKIFAQPARLESAEEKGLRAARLIRALAAGKGDPERAAHWARKQWGDTDVVKALAASTPEAGGYLVPPEYSREIIELLRPRAVVRRLGATVLPMDTGTLNVPKVTGGAAASYVGENTNIARSEPAFGQLTLTWKKLAVLVPVSNDLLRFATPGADTVVRDDLVNAMAQREDLAFIRDDGTSNKPKGLLYWAPSGNKVNANATVNLENVTVDLGQLILKLKSANVRFIRPGWIMSPRTEFYLMTVRDGNGNFAFREEMLQGRLFGFPYAVTTQIPENLGTGGNESEVYLADFADAVIGEATQLVIDASTEAAYHDGANVVAAFSLDQTVIRAIAHHDFGMRHPESVAVLQQVKWGAPSA